MSKTALKFYRKSQTLSDLEHERPKSLDTVRDSILEATREIIAKINDLERSFYGGQRSDHYIRSVMPRFRDVFCLFQITYVNNASQIDEIICQIKDPLSNFKYDPHSFSALKEYHEKLLDYIPGKVQPLMDDIRHIVGFLKKYCKSFFSLEPNEHLETCHHYECRIQDYDEAIEMHLNNITNMRTAYGNQGLAVRYFGLHSNELARSCDCGDMPFVLLFPEAIQNLLNACAGIKKWVEADEQYTDFIQHDLTEIASKLEEQRNKTQSSKQRAWMLEHKVKGVKFEIEELEKAIARLVPREKQFHAEIEELEKHIRLTDIDIELQEQERERIIAQQDVLMKQSWHDTTPLTNRVTDSPLKRARERLQHELEMKSHMICTPMVVKSIDDDVILDPVIARKRLEDIADAISKARFDIPTTRKQIAQVKGKMTIITDKRKDLKSKREYLKELSQDTASAKAQAVILTKKLKDLEAANQTLKEIHCKKTASDLPKKIFHKLPVKIKNARHKIKRGNPPTKPTRDALDRVTSVIAANIKDDWQKMYRSLPFNPPRGEDTLDNDLDRIIKDKYRTNEASMAQASMKLWRRQHTLANVNEIRNTLEGIQRKDLLPKIADARKRPAPKPIPGQKAWNRIRQVNKSLRQMAVLKAKRQVANRAFLTQHNAARATEMKRELTLPKIIVTDASL